jgi:hypothetical protein
VTIAAVGVAAALIVALLFAFGPNKNAAPEVLSNLPADLPAPQVKAPLSDEARRVAVRFIQTAVARKNLPEAWTLVGPNLKGGLTRAEWITGNNPVVPYPIADLDVAPFKVDDSFKDSALIEVALIPKPGAGIKPQLFFLALERLGSGPTARWVVNNWVPRASVVLPR